MKEQLIKLVTTLIFLVHSDKIYYPDFLKIQTNFLLKPNGDMLFLIPYKSYYREEKNYYVIDYGNLIIKVDKEFIKEAFKLLLKDLRGKKVSPHISKFSDDEVTNYYHFLTNNRNQ